MRAGLTFLFFLCLACLQVWASQSPGVDEHTIALWLFDERQYLNTTLTDASPHEYDLSLLAGGQLVPGKFGNALKLTAEPKPAVAYAGAQGWYNLNRLPPPQNVPEQFNVGYFDWTWEFWFQPAGLQAGSGTVFELRSRAYGGGSVAERNSLVLSADARSFIIRSPRQQSPQAKLEVLIPTDEAAMSGRKGGWHHVAFTYTAKERQIRHYVDGVLQPLPNKGGFLPVQGNIDQFSVGRDTDGNQPLAGLLDEMRLSDVVRYSGRFAPPASFSSNYGATPPAASIPNGPPLLFGGEPSPRPIRLGSRKHVFIDGALIESKENLDFKVNHPTVEEVTDFTCTKPWEVGPRVGPGVPDILHVYDNGSEIRLVYTNGAMWGGKKPDAISMAVSKDGVHWTKPDFGVVLWDGSTKNNILLTDSSQGTMFKDPNPHAPPDERYKYMAYVMQRGIYVYFSPDGIHWRRNETIALPFDCGGGVETFWDDERGLYATFIRHEGSNLRLGALAETQEITKPWPFQPQPNPRLRGNLHLPTITGELPIAFQVDDQGRQVYRTEAIKYPWAPDTYLAFPWRYAKAKNVRPGSDLSVSRDGVHWNSYGDPLYFTSDWNISGRKVIESLINHGLIRRGNEIWQYATARFTAHGGASYGGEEYDSGLYDRLVRLVQRLDGFVSLDAQAGSGTMITTPLTFEGRRLILNIASHGETRVAILDEAGEVPGFGLADCNPIKADSIEYPVTWRNREGLGSLAGKVIRLEFKMRDTKLYALQFVK